MEPYSILIHAAGPIGTGEPEKSADLLAGELVKKLQESGHNVTHASIQGPEGMILLNGKLTEHPPAPIAKKEKPPKNAAAKKERAAPPPPGGDDAGGETADSGGSDGADSKEGSEGEAQPPAATEGAA